MYVILYNYNIYLYIYVRLTFERVFCHNFYTASLFLQNLARNSVTQCM